MSAAPRLFLTLAEAATACGISEDLIKAAVNLGKLKAKRTGADGGGRYLFRIVDLEAWFETLEDA